MLQRLHDEARAGRRTPTMATLETSSHLRVGTNEPYPPADPHPS